MRRNDQGRVSPLNGASLLLLFVAVLFVVARLLPGEHVGLGLLRAATEAALVGGLADWFAVVALFRHPLGLPIPHTAVIPSNKDRIGENLGTFVEQNFLDPDLIAERLARAEPSRRIGEWLSVRDNAAWLAERAVDAIAIALRSLQDRELKKFVGTALQREFQSISLSPLIGRALRVFMESDRHHQLFDTIVEETRTYLTNNHPTVLRAVETRTAWWVPKQVDREIAGAVSRGLIDLLRDLKEPDHEIRLRFEKSFLAFVDELEHDPQTAQRVAAWAADWLARPEFERFADGLWAALRMRLERDLASETSVMRGGFTEALQSLGRSFCRDDVMRARFDEKLTGAAKTLLVPWRRQIGTFMADVVKGWDARTITERLESAVGRDLQYIRINGTLVGALVGCILFALSHLVF